MACALIPLSVGWDNVQRSMRMANPIWSVEAKNIPLLQQAWDSGDPVYLIFLVWIHPIKYRFGLARMLTRQPSEGEGNTFKWDSKKKASYNTTPVFRIKWLITQCPSYVRWKAYMPASERVTPGPDEMTAVGCMLKWAEEDVSGEKYGLFCANDRHEELQRLRILITPPAPERIAIAPAAPKTKGKRPPPTPEPLPKRQTLFHYFLK